MHRFLLLLSLLAALQLSACGGPTKPNVVVYAALDREFSEPILHDFEKETGITVVSKFDTEANKTVGLATEILQERNRPRCDLFWNNEILQTLRLEKAGVLDAYFPPAAKNFPAGYRSPAGHWHGFAARARVLIVNTKIVPPEHVPRSIRDLANPRWKGQVGMARPLFGTSATHAAVLFAAWGDGKAQEFFTDLRRNEIQIVAGNKQVATGVAGGQLAFGITDTDDAIIERDRGSPITIVFPDQGTGGLGALFIPNTLCLIKGSANQQQAQKLVDYLLQPAVEERLAEGESAQFPVNLQVKVHSRVFEKEASAIQWMKADFPAAADQWDQASKFLRSEFLKE